MAQVAKPVACRIARSAKGPALSEGHRAFLSVAGRATREPTAPAARVTRQVEMGLDPSTAQIGFHFAADSDRLGPALL